MNHGLRAAGKVRIYERDDQLVGADGLAFDVKHNLYVTTDGLGNSLARVNRHGGVVTLADASDGLDYAASIAFGQGHRLERALFIANVGANFNKPTLMRALVPHPGLPLP